jgi:hypothetical protein
VNHTLGRHQTTGSEVRDAHEAARVEPGAGVVAQEVLDRVEAETREELGTPRAYPRQELDTR